MCIGRYLRWNEPLRSDPPALCRRVARNVPVESQLLRSVLDVTLAVGAGEPNRLEHFLARDGLESLAIWLALEPAGPIPSRAEIQARLARDIAQIDAILEDQVNAILHHPRFQALESSWRGLFYMTQQVTPDERIKIRLLSVSWKDVVRDLTRAMEFDQSEIFRKVYTAEFDMPGGEPFGLLIGDYQVRHRPNPEAGDEPRAIAALAQVAAAAFAPFVAGAHPSLLGLESFAELERPIDFTSLFANRNVEYATWNALRQEDDARYVGLTVPRILLREPWVDHPLRTDGFRFKEDVSAPDHSGLLFGNAAFAFGAVVLRAMSETGWPAAIRGIEPGIEGGGLVTGLPTASWSTDALGLVPRGSVDVQITDTLEKELSDLGFVPLCHAHGTPWCAFYGSQSIQKPKRYDELGATVNAKLAGMLQYMLCAGRFAHYIKVITRDKIGSFMTVADCERYVNNWLVDYSTSNEDASSELLAKYPLREASAKVRELPGKPGVYSCIIHLRPHFQLDQMTTSLKLVTELFAGRVS